LQKSFKPICYEHLDSLAAYDDGLRRVLSKHPLLDLF